MGLWTLDGNASDTSGKGNNGTVNGTAQWVPGMVNQALSQEELLWLAGQTKPVAKPF